MDIHCRRSWRPWPFRISVQLVASVLLAGCAIFPYGTSGNQPIPGPTSGTRATDQVSVAELDGAVFVGIAMSGGGSRAANFSAAVLLELERQGLLQHASAVSSVSGSSLTAAYYGLYNRPDEPNPGMWNEAELRSRLGADLQTQLIARWLLPHNVARYWFTNFDRSDVMKMVFEENLFDGEKKTFDDLGSGMPKILFNATSVSGRNFMFTDQEFEAIASDLGPLRLSEAVMASAAFPGAFHNVTLTNFAEEQRYVHLFDGGASDNLGVETLVAMVKAMAQDAGAQQLRGCMFIIVDSTVDIAVKRGEAKSQRSHTRGLFGRAVDGNALDAVYVLLARRRDDTLRAVGYPDGEAFGARPVWSFTPLPEVLDTEARPLQCHVWHIGFQRLPHVGAEGEVLAPIVNNIDTRFNLRGPRLAGEDGRKLPVSKNAWMLQDKLYESAALLVQADDEALRQVRQLFDEWFPADDIRE
ncbi:MAG: patatin-like phospholipase family protein [Chromatiales bacterium]|nr:patatin-like phospholipase family protein [Chromatiales bacterium]